jgi:hypothetical protein
MCAAEVRKKNVSGFAAGSCSWILFSFMGSTALIDLQVCSHPVEYNLFSVRAACGQPMGCFRHSDLPHQL